MNIYTDNFIRLVQRFTDNDTICHKYGHMYNSKFHMSYTYNDPRTVGRKYYKFIMLYARLHRVN